MPGVGLRVIHKYLVAAAVVAAASSSVSAQSVRAGIDAWQHADYARAVEIWRPLAEKGDVDAEFNLGQAYRLGRGVPTNLAAAQTWFERAASKGHVDAETTLGLMLFENGDRPAGIRWLKQAAEKGEPRALLVYGTALFNGDGVKQDPILGYAYVSRAAAQGLAPAQATLEQLDQILPIEQRKKALAIAMAKAKTAPAPSSAPKAQAKAAPVPPQKPQPRTVQTTAHSLDLKPLPHPPLEAKGAIAPTEPGGWRIQLGAFSQPGAAEALFKKLSRALEGRQPFYVASGRVTRLQVGPYASRPAAAAACAALHGQPCFPVPAK
jgi:TPR repeat protein